MYKMFLGLLIAGLSTSANSTCDWSRPGDNPYIGRPDAAVHSFKDLPWLARHLLSQRVGRGTPDDQIDIGRQKIVGYRWTYANEIRNMHFGGAGKVCPSVNREGWPVNHVEPAVVWCTKLPLSSVRHCVAQAHVCGNFFQVTQIGRASGVAPSQAWTPDSPRSVPEPGTLALVLVALAGLRLAKL